MQRVLEMQALRYLQKPGEEAATKLRATRRRDTPRRHQAEGKGRAATKFSKESRLLLQKQRTNPFAPPHGKDLAHQKKCLPIF